MEKGMDIERERKERDKERENKQVRLNSSIQSDH